MESTEASVTRFAIVVAAMTALGIVGGIGACQSYQTAMFVKGGYCQVSVVGQASTVWGKCGDAPKPENR